MGFLDDLKENILIADGAMGTLLYSYGVDACYEELNLSHPDQIIQIHRAYVDAGAKVIQTNTYGANYEKLSRYGFEDYVKDINMEAVRIAKEAAGTQAYVLGTIGGIRGVKKKALSLDEVQRSFREQLYWLLTEGTDGILLETFYDLEELTAVLSIVRKETELPIIAQVSLHEVGILQGGISLVNALQKLEALGADVVGLNCRLGPYHMIRSFEEIPLPQRAYLSAYPNAGLPNYVDGRFNYQSSPVYFGESALQLRNQGVRLIGGCCGTTPKHVEAMSKALRGVKPLEQKSLKVKDKSEKITIKELQQEPQIHEVVQRRTSIIVELDPPKHLQMQKFLDGAKALKEAGIDALTMADNSLASPRISNMAMGVMIKQELQLRPLIHISCRDRNLIGLQSHIMGLHALGMNHVLAITGDPARVGDFPGATSVYDLSSFELIALLKQFNQGISYSGKTLNQPTSFSIAAAFNPNVRYLEKEVLRLEKKIAHGADYFISQPLFSEQQIEEVYEATKHLNVPIFIGIMPLTSFRNAEFLHNEVPGIKLSDRIRKQMAQFVEDPASAKKEGLLIAKALIDAALNYFTGIYLITPFMNYELTVDLVHYVHQKKKERELTRGKNII